MKKHVLALLAATALSTVAAPAFAQEGIDRRQNAIETRIERGVQQGDLTRAEAQTLRNDLRAIDNLQAQYNRDGRLTDAERKELDRQTTALERRTFIERNDRDERGGGAFTGAWEPLRQKESEFNQRVDAGMRAGNLNRAEADRLRRDYTAFVNLATGYRQSAGGYSAAERSELQRRYDFLVSQIRYDQAEFEPISRRVDNLENRIRVGERNGSITRAEAATLRSDIRELVNLEASYRRSDNRLETREKADLDRRFNIIRDRVMNARTDSDVRPGGGNAGWWPIADREQMFQRRLAAGIANRTISQAEAVRLRSEWTYLRQLEQSYRRDGIDNRERAELERRFNILASKLRWAAADYNNRR